jgi:hypothetical protein
MMEKTLHDFMYPGSGESLAIVERKPDETLDAYMERCQSELGDRIVLLASVRDGYLTTLGRVRARWRRRWRLLVFIGPVIPALAYVGFAWCEIDKVVPAPLIAGLIACAGLAGAPLALVIARIVDQFPHWVAERRARRWR